MKPTLSVIIPVFQEEKILYDTLKLYDNNLKKKFNFELIISDGGSTDSTIKIAQQFTNKIAIHSNNRKQTIAEGRNKGAELASSDTLIFINADTRPANIDSFFSFISNWAASKVEDNNNTSDITLLNKYHKYSALATTVQPFPEEKIFIDNFFYGFFNSYFNFLNIIGIGMGRGECQIINKNVFNSIGGYNPHLIAGEDFELFKRIAKSHKVAFVKKLKVYESPRRFRKQGYIKTVLRWTANGLSVIFNKKSVSKQWDTVR